MATGNDPIQNFATATQANLNALDAKLTDLQNGISNLDQLIIQFQNSPGTLSEQDQAFLDQIQAQSAALVAKANAISVVPPSTTPPGTPGTGPVPPTATDVVPQAKK